MAEPLHPSAQKVQDALARLGFTNRVTELSAAARTAAEAAQAIGCRVDQIAKSLVFKGTRTRSPILVIASGGRRVNERVVAECVAEPVEKADAEFVRRETGFAIGGVPPVGHHQSLTTLIDQDLLTREAIWAAAGHPNAIFKLTADELIRMTGGRIVSIT